VTNIKLTHQQWKKILEFLRTRSDLYIGKPLTCKHFITGVLWMTRSGAQWRLLPKKYGEWNAVYKRFDRWSERGIWTAMFEHFASEPDMESVMIDATIVRAHSSAAVKGGIKRRKRSGEARVASRPKSMPL
jgi:transposase